MFLVDVYSLELPTYIRQCSLSDPELNKCSLESAINAVPHLIKGDKDYGIPAVQPLTLAKGKFGGDELTIDVLKVTGDAFKDVKVHDVQFDYEAKQMGFDATIDKFTLSGRYSITNGVIGEYRTHGNGDFNITLVGNTLNFQTEINMYQKGKESYVRITDSNLRLDTETAHFFFENLQARGDPIDMNEYINENWELLFEEIKPSLEEYLMKYVRYVVDGITNNVPFNKIYAP
ncbi:hypothetical protein Trydic_g9026 [Trypoxylus dichotomus]